MKLRELSSIARENKDGSNPAHWFPTDICVTKLLALNCSVRASRFTSLLCFILPQSSSLENLSLLLPSHLSADTDFLPAKKPYYLTSSTVRFSLCASHRTAAIPGNVSFTHLVNSFQTLQQINLQQFPEKTRDLLKGFTRQKHLRLSPPPDNPYFCFSFVLSMAQETSLIV